MQVVCGILVCQRGFRMVSVLGFYRNNLSEAEANGLETNSMSPRACTNGSVRGRAILLHTAGKPKWNLKEGPLKRTLI